jgi:proteasome lid subunit RPN8/RPN11
MWLHSAPDQLHAMIEHARSAPDEVCGVLVGQREPLQIKSIVAGRNVHPQPQQHYLIDAATLLHADDLAWSAGQEIIGFYHSHPHGAAVPSPHDRHDAWPGYVYVIVAWANDMAYVCAWIVDEHGKTHPLRFIDALR